MLMKRARRLPSCIGLFLFAIVSAQAARAADYLPMPDRDLAREATAVVLARAVDQKAVLGTVGNENRPFSLTTFETVEVLKGDLPSRFQVRLPGGIADGRAWAVPGTPTFDIQSEVVLFLDPLNPSLGEYRLTELGLSKFDVVQDAAGRSFAIRPEFRQDADDYLSGRAQAPGAGAAIPAASTPVRDLNSFLAALRAEGSGQEPNPIQYASPTGALSRQPRGASPMWVNIGGREPGNCGGTPCLFRWFWDTGSSPAGVVYVTGTQSGLTDGTNGVTHVQNAVDKWNHVAGSNVQYSGVASSSVQLASISATGNVNEKLDVSASADGTAWTTPMGCSGGVLGVAGPDPSPPAPGPFKGDANYYAIPSATVEMRKSSCASGYPAAVFRSAVLHETGHTLGLGHPDLAQSTHSTTTSLDWSNAVMRSVIPNALPDSPQTDDIQAVQYYYPASSAAVCTPDAATLCLNSSRFKVQAQYTTAAGSPPIGETESALSSGPGQAVPLTSDTGYFWFFSANNVEMIIKVVDGTAVNGKFWVFAAGLTNVNVVITVTDTKTGAVKTYTNPQGTAFQPIQDTGAFAMTPEESLKAPASAGASALQAATAAISTELSGLLASGVVEEQGADPFSTLAAQAVCVPDATTLCLNAGRFQVRVTWTTSTGSSGAGQAVPITADTGYFWFFSSNNVEMLLKVVAGCALNNNYWVFAGGLTNVKVVITVTDMLTGTVKTYTNPQGTAFQPIQDTSAFSCAVSPAAFAGNWSGQWNNTTFSTTGPASMVVNIDTAAQTFQTTLTLGGNVFGGSAPPPQNFSGSLSTSGISISQSSPVFGNVTATIGADGTVTGSLTNVPNASISRVDFTGAATPATITINYTITFSASGGGGKATGVMVLNHTS
jgi:hypothetical protein